jgi:hypothetical protein
VTTRKRAITAAVYLRQASKEQDWKLTDIRQLSPQLATGVFQNCAILCCRRLRKGEFVVIRDVSLLPSGQRKRLDLCYQKHKTPVV